MKILVLGTGGFDNEGLPFNAFLVDGRLLVECPPDIVASLGREGIDPAAITAIFVSHTHGDHCFGLPFLLFRLWKLSGGGAGPELVGPAGLRDRTLELCALAISKDHPYLGWVSSSCRFTVVAGGTSGSLGGHEARFARSVHEAETLGFILSRAGRPLLSWIPDTRWDPSIRGRLAAGAELTLCDINGTGGFSTVHMSLAEVEAGARATLVPSARVLGTHVSGPLPPALGRVGVAEPGMVLVAGAAPRESALAALALHRRALAAGRSTWLAAAGEESVGSELATLDRLARFIEAKADAMSRSCGEGHVTGSAFVVDASLSRVLLVHHAKLDKWLQPGGHCEGGEGALEAALREAREETALGVVPVAGSFLLDVDIHAIPARAGVPAHLHHDLRWLFEALPGAATASEESHAVEWLTLEEALARNGEESMRRPLAKIAALAATVSSQGALS